MKTIGLIAVAVLAAQVSFADGPPPIPDCFGINCTNYIYLEADVPQPDEWGLSCFVCPGTNLWSDPYAVTTVPDGTTAMVCWTNWSSSCYVVFGSSGLYGDFFSIWNRKFTNYLQSGKQSIVIQFDGSSCPCTNPPGPSPGYTIKQYPFCWIPPLVEKTNSLKLGISGSFPNFVADSWPTNATVDLYYTTDLTTSWTWFTNFTLDATGAGTLNTLFDLTPYTNALFFKGLSR